MNVASELLSEVDEDDGPRLKDRDIRGPRAAPGPPCCVRPVEDPRLESRPCEGCWALCGDWMFLVPSWDGWRGSEP